MKYLLILLSFLFVVNVSFAQTEQEATNSTVVGHDWQFTTLGDFSGVWTGTNPYTGTITPSGSNLTVITANTLSNIATGDIAICTNGGMYEITVTTPGASPVVSMQLINDPINLGIGLAPSGSRGYIGRPNAEGILPTNVIDGGAGGGLSDVFSNLIATYNSSQTSARINKVGLETVTEAAHTKTAGQVVQYEAGVWSLASQITVATTGKVGNLGLIVSTTTNTFDVATADGVYDVGSALFTDNDTYYLAATAGNMITVLGSLPDEDIHFLGTGVGTNSILWSPHNVLKTSSNPPDKVYKYVTHSGTITAVGQWVTDMSTGAILADTINNLSADGIVESFTPTTATLVTKGVAFIPAHGHNLDSVLYLNGAGTDTEVRPNSKSQNLGRVIHVDSILVGNNMFLSTGDGSSIPINGIDSVTVNRTDSKDSLFLNHTIHSGATTVEFVDTVVQNTAFDYYQVRANSHMSPAPEVVTADADAFGNILICANGDWLTIHRRGPDAETSDGTVRQWRSTDKGATWVDEGDIAVTVGRDLRDPYGGVTANGNVVIFFGVIEQPITPTTKDTESLNYMISTDNGVTWGAQQIYGSITATQENIAAYGKLEVNEETGKTLKSFYVQNDPLATAVFEVYVTETLDNGLTWGAPTLITSDASGIDNHTETDIVWLQGMEWIAVARRDGRTKFRQYYSDDDGVTWSDQGDIEVDTFPNVSPCWLETFTGTDGNKKVALYWADRSDLTNYHDVRVVYANSTDFGTLKKDAWKLETRRALANYVNTVGYPSFIHPWGDERGYGIIFENTNPYWMTTDENSVNYLRVKDRLVGLGVNPINALDVRNTQSLGVAIGDYAGVNSAPNGGLIMSGSLRMGSPTATGAKAVIEDGLTQLKLSYTGDVGSTTFTTSNIGYMTITPSGGRLGIGTVPTSTLQAHDPSALARFRLTNSTGGTTNGAEVLYTGNIAYFLNRGGGGISFATGETAGSSLERLRITGAGEVGIGTITPDASAIFHVASTTQGVLFSPMTATERDAIVSPAAGLLIYNTTSNQYNFYNGTEWRELSSITAP